MKEIEPLDLESFFAELATAFVDGFSQAVEEDLPEIEHNYRIGTMGERLESSMLLKLLAPEFPKAREIILRAARSKNPVTRALAAQHLGDLGSDFAHETRPVLEELVWDKDERVRKRAKVAMEKIVGTKEDLQDK